ncbi:hypothetical protein GlitD10_1485 [Gloeomargarita lithophora Alchichica-D10]|uniref:Uncharacterized protein n=1 Tax=Gloeomargarita lithophora Alchichica-D10 TaxID=1188229 RepID=A0A1J0AD18_9CYAN|nr:hypothetical protein [Gloeomargarita lithophora]APB33807.1 hypothetical protein GlitD10_1485 [Gloeomargarita lithophora Alchichica-D10]
MRWRLSVLNTVVFCLVIAPAGIAQESKGRAADLPTRARTTGNVNYGQGGNAQIRLRQEKPGGWPLPFGVQFGPGLTGGDPGSGPAGYGADSILVEIVVPVN